MATIELGKRYRHLRRGYVLILEPTGQYVKEDDNDPNSDSYHVDVYEFTVVEQAIIPEDGKCMIGQKVWVSEMEVNEIFTIPKKDFDPTFSINMYQSAIDTLGGNSTDFRDWPRQDFHDK